MSDIEEKNAQVVSEESELGRKQPWYHYLWDSFGKSPEGRSGVKHYAIVIDDHRTTLGISTRHVAIDLLGVGVVDAIHRSDESGHGMYVFCNNTRHN
jgi:hypothetical protein